MSENKKSSDSELKIEERTRLIFEKAKELCNLLGPMPFACITIDSDNFCISQLYDKDSSFVDEGDNSDYDGSNRSDNGDNRSTK